MTRADLAFAIEEFFVEFKELEIAKLERIDQINVLLDEYLCGLEENFDAIDRYTLYDLSGVYSYLLREAKYIRNAERATKRLEQTASRIHSHREFLCSHDILPGYLESWRL